MSTLTAISTAVAIFVVLAFAATLIVYIWNKME